MNFDNFKYYIVGALTFLLVLFCGEFIFSLNYKRKEHFALRYCLSHLSVMVVSLLPTLLYYGIASYNNIVLTNVIVVIVYLLMFLLSIIAMRICYWESVSSCLIAGVAGYTCQHISYGIYSIVNSAAQLEFKIYSLVDFNIGLGYPLSVLLQLVFAAAVLALMYIVFAGKAIKFSPDGVMNKNVILISVATLTVVLVMNAFCNIFASESNALNIIGKSLLIICCVFILILRTGMLESGKLKSDLDAITELHERERQHYDKLKENMELISIKCHDIKHYIESADKCKGIDTEELNKLVTIYDTNVKTGNDTIDTLLSERNLYCSAHNIRMTVLADASQLEFIGVTDMCSLFGNMLENAIEAVDKIEDGDKRIINIVIRPIANQVFLCVENYFAEEPRLRDGLPVSQKEDSDYHGFGMKSIKLITEKYDGVFSWGIEKDIFRISILFPVK